MQALLTMLLSDRFEALAKDASKAPRSAEAEALRAQIRQEIQKKSAEEEKPKDKGKK
jgi:hypothetical protein